MREVGVLEAKTKLSSLVAEIEAGGGDVVITRHGKPVARLTAPPRPRADKAGAAERFRALREEIARKYPASEEPFDWKAAIEEGRM